MLHRCHILSEVATSKYIRRQDYVEDPAIPQDRIWKIPFNMHQGFCSHVNDDNLKPTGAL